MTMFRSALGLIAATGLALTAPGVASAETATAGMQAIAFGKCIVKADRGAATSLFQTLPVDSTAVALGTMALGNGASCASGLSTLSSMAVRGAVAEALYARDFVEAGLQPRRSQGNFAQLNLPEGAADANGMFALGLCVAKARFAVVDKLFAVPAGSRREAEIVDAMMPYFAACQPKGTQVALKRSDIRPLLAQSAYEANVRYWARQSGAGA